MNSAASSPEIPGPKSWRGIVSRYEKPELSKSTWQLINSLGPYLLLWPLMVYSLQFSVWLTLLLTIPAAGFLVRIFIISHDCGHRSFFNSAKSNNFWGTVTSTLTFIPYVYWRREHARHHATSGNLDARGIGDIWTLTVKEYLEKPFWVRLKYRLYRNPVVLFGIGPLTLFLIRYRFSEPGSSPEERRSVYRTNISILALVVLAELTIGLKAFLMIQLPVMLIASTMGVWLFYVQHQFEGVYWERKDTWDYLSQAMDGSSYYKLPKVLQWFTGNIGFHHIHHLSPRIPNYLLEKCHRENKLFQRVPELTLWRSFKSLTFRLWDEDRRQLVGFGCLKRFKSAAPAA